MGTPEDDLESTARPDGDQPEELSTAELLDVPPETAAKIDEKQPKPGRSPFGFLSWIWGSSD